MPVQMTLYPTPWILCFSTLPPDSGTFIINLNAKVILIWKGNKQLSSYFSPLPQFSGHICEWWLLTYWLQPQSTPCEALPSSWIGFIWQSCQGCGHPCWSDYTFPFQSTFLEYVLVQHPEQPALSVMALCGTFLMEDVIKCLLDNCQVSNCSHYCDQSSSQDTLLISRKTKAWNISCCVWWI